MVPFLKDLADLNDPTAFTRWNKHSISLISALPPSQSFPVLDFLRLAVLKAPYSKKLADLPREFDPIQKAVQFAISKDEKYLGRAFSLTLLRLLSNAIGVEALTERFVQGPTRRLVTQYLINVLLSEDEAVRVTACSVCYGLVCGWSSSRAEWLEPEGEQWESGFPSGTNSDDEEWEVELMSALLEALKRERDPKAKADVGECLMPERMNLRRQTTD